LCELYLGTQLLEIKIKIATDFFVNTPLDSKACVTTDKQNLRKLVSTKVYMI